MCLPYPPLPCCRRSADYLGLGKKAVLADPTDILGITLLGKAES